MIILSLKTKNVLEWFNFKKQKIYKAKSNNIYIISSIDINKNNVVVKINIETYNLFECHPKKM